LKTLTVITTTYNRAYCIGNLYDSLVRQTSDDFVWLVVDDGSSDNTEEVIKGFIDEGKIEIVYIKQKNAGMHGARNTAYDNVTTEINTIIDDDDYMTDDAVEKITDFWKKNKKDGVVGFIAYDVDLDGKIIGTLFPEGIGETTTTELVDVYGMKGDKKLIYRSDIIRENPFPVFEGEKFFPASYKYRLIDLKYKILTMPEAVCVVDCNQNSMTNNKVAQYRSCAKGFAFYRNEMIKISEKPKYIIRETIHYIAESLLSGNKHFIKTAHKKGYAILCAPVGVPLYWYIKYTKKKAIKP